MPHAQQKTSCVPTKMPGSHEYATYPPNKGRLPVKMRVGHQKTRWVSTDMPGGHQNAMWLPKEVPGAHQDAACPPKETPAAHQDAMCSPK